MKEHNNIVGHMTYFCAHRTRNIMNDRLHICFCGQMKVRYVPCLLKEIGSVHFFSMKWNSLFFLPNIDIFLFY